MKIILIDDDEITASSIAYFLRKKGHEVTTYSDGNEGAKALLSSPPDLVITDMMMPHITGFDILKKAKNELPKPIMVFLITGFDQPELVKMALDMGVDDFAIKPINLSELSLRVQRLERNL